MPRIGAAKSTDDGRTWNDLGPVIQALPERHGVRVDQPLRDRRRRRPQRDARPVDKTYLYFFYSQYHRDPLVAGRRDRADCCGPIAIGPAGRSSCGATASGSPKPGGASSCLDCPAAERWRLEWVYPAASPLIAPAFAWHDGDDKVDAFWGPSVHWNTAIEQYVMLLNRAKDENYAQEGIYVSYAPRLDDPSLWTAPQKLLNGGRWYPQVVGSSIWHRDRQARGRLGAIFHEREKRVGD